MGEKELINEADRHAKDALRPFYFKLLQIRQIRALSKEEQDELDEYSKIFESPELVHAYVEKFKL